MNLWCPGGGESILRDAVNLGVERVPYEVRIRALEPGEALGRGEYDIIPFRTDHGGRTLSLGYAVVEHHRLGRFDPERARELGVPEGPMWGRLHRGESVEVDGRTITHEDLVGPPRPGRKIVYTGDTRPCRETVERAHRADLLIHEATFAQEDADRARATGHATAREAAEVARDADVRRLMLTHISPRYADQPKLLEREARAVFRAARVARDGLELDIPFRDS